MNIPLVTLLIFCAEGDNIPGVLLVAGNMNKWLNIVSVTGPDNTPIWKFPKSWNLFFGAPAPVSIY